MSRNKTLITKEQFLARTYHNMYTRVTGKCKERSRHLYAGLDIINKADFIKWALKNPTFNLIFALWKSTGCSCKFSPSIDRINSDKGYIKKNMRWLTHSENSVHGNKSHKRKLKVA